MRRVALSLALAASACTVGPNYKRPVTELPDTYRGAAAIGAPAADQPSIEDQPIEDQKWWELFQDGQLQELIQTALRQNFDVRIAAVRIAEARAQFGITRADQSPQVDASGLVERERIPARIGLLQVNPTASWEMDFWGQFRRATEGARATLAATEWGRRAVVTSLVAQVAEAYFTLCAIDLNVEISRRTLDSRKESLRLTQVRADGGATSELDVREA